MASKMVDVSRYQGDIDWHKVKAAGYSYAYIQSADGDQHDPTYSSARVKALREAKVVFGPYCYARVAAPSNHERNGATECAMQLKFAQSAGWGHSGDLRFMYDFEETNGQSPAKAGAHLVAFLRAYEGHTGHLPTLYTGLYFFSTIAQTLSKADLKYVQRAPLMAAEYVSVFKRVLPWNHYAAWQYSDKGIVPGIKGGVDVNRVAHANWLVIPKTVKPVVNTLPKPVKKTSPKATKHTGPNWINPGDKGSQVRKLQNNLNAIRAKGQRVLHIDGNYGPTSQARAIEFKRHHGLTSDAVVGPQTWRALAKSLAAHLKAPIKKTPVRKARVLPDLFGNYSNGKLPAAILASIPNGHIWVPAAHAWNAMSAASVKRGTGPLAVEGPEGSYRDYAHQVQLWNLYTSGKGNLAAHPGTSNHGEARAVDIASPAQRKVVDQIGARYGWAKRWSDAPCVPLDTRILTRRGLLSVEELRAGDETVGYDPTTGQSAWTPVLDWIIQENVEVLRHAHSTVTLDATADHRWLTTGRDCNARASLATLKEVGCQDRILLAASGAEGEGLPITAEEAGLIGWALTDGSIYRFQNNRGLRAFARIYQRKAIGVATVDALMESFNHRRDDNYNDKCVMWYVGRGVFSPILHRSRLDDLGVVRFVLALNSDQRCAFLDAVRMAEGTQANGMCEIAQAEPDRREAIAIAAALEGYLPAFRARTVNLKREAVRRDSLQESSLGIQDVWCPVTGLGTWTAEQNGHIFLTGNSEWWHLVWRAGIYVDPVIVEVQRHLKLKADGFWGPNTNRALRAFQTRHGLDVDGIPGPKTLTSLRAS